MIETIQKNPGRRYLMADGDTLFQRMFYLRGFENLMLDLVERRPETAALRDRIVEFMLRRIELWAEYGVDGLFFRDDWGTQQELMIRPALWREFFQSDGVIDAIIPDLIEIGADAINAQIPCMDADMLAREFGVRLCFVAGADRQHWLPFGTRADVEAHCLRLANTFGRGNGGYIGGGEISADVPLANAEAMLRTFTGYAYPRP